MGIGSSHNPADMSIPQPVAEGEVDYSDIRSLYDTVGVDQNDIDSMRGTIDNGYLTDAGIRAILLESMDENEVYNSEIALFDPAWLSQWMEMPTATRIERFENAFPAPLQKPDGQDVEIIILPFNIDSVHWCLIVINIPFREVIIYDSIPGSSTYRCKEAVLAFGEVFSAGLGGDDWFDQYELIIPEISQQADHNSCGCHTILNTLALLGRDRPEDMYPRHYHQHDIPQLRRTWARTLRLLRDGHKVI